MSGKNSSNSATHSGYGGQFFGLGGLQNSKGKAVRRIIRNEFTSILGLQFDDKGRWFRPVFTHSLAPSIEWREIYTKGGFPTDDYMEKVIRIATDIGTSEKDIVDGEVRIPARKLNRIFAEAAKDF